MVVDTLSKTVASFIINVRPVVICVSGKNYIIILTLALYMVVGLWEIAR